MPRRRSSPAKLATQDLVGLVDRFGPRSAVFQMVVAPNCGKSTRAVSSIALAYYEAIVDAIRYAIVNPRQCGTGRSLQAPCTTASGIASEYFDLLVDAVGDWLVLLGDTVIESDVFKPLFHSLFPGKVRHAEGEFYTPDWLADLVLNRTEYVGQLDLRVVDPMCGSGTFIVLAIARLREVCRKEKIPAAQSLGRIVRNVVGLDRNLVAVKATQANYLLAIRDLLPHAESGFKPPVYCCDAIELGLDDAPRFEGDARSIGTLGRFDRVIGNPPWIGWETLPTAMRLRTAPLWKRYGLFSHDGMATILGKGKKDLATLLSFVATDCLLADGGKLGFVMPQALFKSSAADGFRRFRLGADSNATPFHVEFVDDLSDVQPFPDAITQTAIVVWSKGTLTRYPVPCRIWQRLGKGIAKDAVLATVEKQTRRLDCVAQPSRTSETASSWFIAFPGCFEPLQPLLGCSEYRAYEGVNTGGANGILWVQRIANLPNGLARVANLASAGKRPVREIVVDVEEELLFPILRGVEVGRWQADSTAFVLLVQDAKERRGIDPATLERDFPRAAEYLHGFETELRARKMFARYFVKTGRNAAAARETGPFYSMFNVGPYTMSPFKTVWHRMLTPVQAAVVGQMAGKPILPQETHAFVPCQSADEAHFIAGLLNSTPFNFAAFAALPSGTKSFASPHILQRLRIPRFDAMDGRHRQLAMIARQSANAARISNRSGNFSSDESLDLAAAAIWNLNFVQQRMISEAFRILTKADLTTS